MKKQLFILLIAIMASFNVAWAQLSCPVPQNIQCLTSGALNPVPGTEYEYTVSVSGVGGINNYNWFVTQSTQFLTAGSITATIEPEDGSGNVLAGVNLVAAGSDYNVTVGGTATIHLTWKAFDPTIPTFVVIQVLNVDGCATNNLKVFKIEPVNAFTLDIANINSTSYSLPSVLGWGVANNSCIDGMITALWDATTETVQNDYGTDTTYYLINAANFTDSYVLSFQLDGVAAGETVTADWSYGSSTTITGLTWNAIGAPTGGTGTTADPFTFASVTVNAQATSGSVGVAGECIIVRVVLDHTFSIAVFNEGLTAQPVKLAVDAVTGINTDVPDVHHATGPLCGLADAFANDHATHTLNPRPTITATTPTPFVTGTGL